MEVLYKVRGARVGISVGGIIGEDCISYSRDIPTGE